MSVKDKTKGIVFAFGSATTIEKNFYSSGDYPAAVIRRLKGRGWDFGMYMAGMVGSHRFVFMPEQDFDAVEREAEILTNAIDSASVIPLPDSLTMKIAHIPLQFGPSQLRIAKDWKVRDWVFKELAYPLKGQVTYLQIGSLVFMGTPCDFSGELYTVEGLGALASQSGKKLIITSFNGDYVGYITYDPHYEVRSKEEVMALNWVGPHYGEYFSEIVKKLLTK